MPFQFDTLSSSGLRRLVRDLRRALSETGQPPMAQHVAQEVVARQLGHADWHAAHQQALRVDRMHAVPVSAPLLSPSPSSPVRSAVPSRPNRAIEKLPIVTHVLFADEQIVLEQLRQGVPLKTAAESYFKGHLAQRSPNEEDLNYESDRLALALATTEGPWIHSWHVASEASKGYLRDAPTFVPNDEAFRALVGVLLRADEDARGDEWYSGPLREQIDGVLSGTSQYRPSLINYASRGQISAESPALAIFEDSRFAHLLKVDVAAAATWIKPFIFDETTTPADRLGMLQRLVDEVGRFHPAQKVRGSQRMLDAWEPVQVPSSESMMLLANLLQIEPMASTLKSAPSVLMGMMSVLSGSDRYKTDSLAPSGSRRGKVQDGPLLALLDAPEFHESLTNNPAQAARQLAPVLSNTPQEQWVAAYQRLVDQTSQILPSPEEAKAGMTLQRLGRLTLSAAMELDQVVERALQQEVVHEVKRERPAAKKSLGEVIRANPEKTPASHTPSRRRSR